MIDNLNWQHEKKRYFAEDDAHMCYVESNSAIAGKPLWPRDSDFDPAKISSNIQTAQNLISSLGGHIFAGHLSLNDDRSPLQSFVLKDQPTALKSVFVTVILIPFSAIQNGKIGFYPINGEVPTLHEITHDIKETGIVTNLGHYVTKNLIVKKEEGGLSYSHNERHDLEEALPPHLNSYLGGFFVREEQNFIAGPVLFGTSGIGIKKNGQPIIIDKIEMAGGKIRIGDFSCAWSKEDVNPKTTERDVILYTPGFNTAASETPEWKSYKNIIGDKRINIVIMNESDGEKPVPVIAYVKEGKIKQPAGAVVISLASSFRTKLPCQLAPVSFEFEPWFELNLWNELQCFYEGLIGFNTDGSPDFKKWQHPHAILTQETYIPNPLRREPRLCYAQMKNDFGIFVFSGRYEDSIGIAYQEISPIIKGLLKEYKIKDEVIKLTCLDSGSSVKACLLKDNQTYPLNWIAPGTRNALGDEQGNTHSTMMFLLKEK